MSYYDQPKFWYVTGKFLKEHPNVIDLIWPNGLADNEYIGEFYQVSFNHVNASLLALALADCEVRYINRNDIMFPSWNRSRAGNLVAIDRPL